MQIKKELLPFVTGEKYTNHIGPIFEFERSDFQYRSRIDLLAELCAEKDVVHVGCVDHNVETIEKKIARGKWLHKTLCERAQRCFGVDIHEQGIGYLRDQLGYEDVAAADILECTNEILLTKNWDFLLLPEVLEHIDNPVDFLSRLRSNFCENIARIVITVPNAFALSNFRNSRRGHESINSDHRYWFTPYTLAKVATRAGLEIEQLALCRHGIVKRRSFWKNWYYKRYPMLRNDIVLTARFKKQTETARVNVAA